MSDARTDPKMILRNYAGAVLSRRNRATGTTITLYNTAECGLGDPTEGKWSTVCENHGAIVQHDSRRNASLAMSCPDWCDDCRESMEKKASAK